MRSKITMGFAGLVLGAALASTSAFAQSSGRSPNDGGLVTQGDYYSPQKSNQKLSPKASDNFKQGDYYSPQSTQRSGQ